MPVKSRRRKVIDDYPLPWDFDRPVSLERWTKHRERLLANERAGRRPLEWWQFEGPCAYPGRDRETVVLYEAGLLPDDELPELLPR